MRSLLAVLALLLAAPASAQLGPTGPSYVPLASWLNDAAHEDDAARLVAALAAAGIHGVATCSVGCTLSVPGGDFGRALGIANDLVAREHLDVSVLAPVITS